MKSQEVKLWIQKRFYMKDFTMTCTEFEVVGGWADVFAIQHKTKYTMEFEIKVDMDDFLSEIRTIDYLLDGDSSRFKGGKLNKEQKHRAYINDITRYLDEHYIVPNKFYFVITNSIYKKLDEQWTNVLKEEVLEGALSDLKKIEEILSVIGYGLYIIHDEPRNIFISQSLGIDKNVNWTWDTIMEKKLQPRFLHKNKQDHILPKFAQRCFQENYNNFIQKADFNNKSIT